MLPIGLSNAIREYQAGIRVILPPHFTPLNKSDYTSFNTPMQDKKPLFSYFPVERTVFQSPTKSRSHNILHESLRRFVIDAIITAHRTILRAGSLRAGGPCGNYRSRRVTWRDLRTPGQSLRDASRPDSVARPPASWIYTHNFIRFSIIALTALYPNRRFRIPAPRSAIQWPASWAPSKIRRKFGLMACGRSQNPINLKPQ